MRKLLIFLLLIPLIGFGQLPTTNLTMDTIKTILSESTFDLSLLVKSTAINKWSLKKPVVQDGSPDWWNYTATNITYSILQTPLTNGLDGLVYDEDSDWTLQRPTSNYKQGWFRGYYHSATPSVITSDQPSGNVRNTVPAWSQIVTTAGASNITVSNLGYASYYYGVLVEWGTTWENKWIITNETPLSSGAVDIDFDYHIVPFSSSYTGDYRWTSFISSVEIDTTEVSRWRTLNGARVAYSGEVILVTSEEGSYVKSGTFNTNIDIVPSASTINISWEDNSTGSITVDVTPNSLPTTSVTGDTGDGIFVTITAGATATGDFTLTVEATSENPTSVQRECKVTITDDWGEATPVVITIRQMGTPVQP